MTEHGDDATFDALRDLPAPPPPPLGAALEAELDALEAVATRRPLRDFARVALLSLAYGAAFLFLLTLRRDLHGLPTWWLIAYGLAGLALTSGLLTMRFLSLAVLVIWFAVGVLAVRLYGFTPGQYLLRLRVASIDNRLHVGTGRAAARGLLIALVIPALFTDSDGRGFQDRLTATAVVLR